MHSDHPETRPHKNKHVAERFEGLLGTLMVVAIVVLAIGMIYAIATGDPTPSWMR
jgi:cell division protein FtsL